MQTGASANSWVDSRLSKKKRNKNWSNKILHAFFFLCHKFIIISEENYSWAAHNFLTSSGKKACTDGVGQSVSQWRATQHVSFCTPKSKCMRSQCLVHATCAPPHTWCGATISLFDIRFQFYLYVRELHYVAHSCNIRCARPICGAMSIEYGQPLNVSIECSDFCCCSCCYAN